MEARIARHAAVFGALQGFTVLIAAAFEFFSESVSDPLDLPHHETFDVLAGVGCTLVVVNGLVRGSRLGIFAVGSLLGSTAWIAILAVGLAHGGHLRSGLAGLLVFPILHLIRTAHGLLAAPRDELDDDASVHEASWRWKLDGGTRVTLRVDHRSGVETVIVDDVVATRSPPGFSHGAIVGHDLTLPGYAAVRVVYDPRAFRADLFIGGRPLAPIDVQRGPTPVRRRSLLPASIVLSFGLASLWATGAIALIVDFVHDKLTHETTLTQTYSCPRGYFTTRYPSDFDARTLTDGVLLHRPAPHEVGLLILVLESPETDLERVSQTTLADNFSRDGSAYHPTSTKIASDGEEELCFRHHGVATVGTFESVWGHRAQLSSCTFRRGDELFFVADWHDLPRKAADGPLLRDVLAATTLTTRAAAAKAASSSLKRDTPVANGDECATEGELGCSADGKSVLVCHDRRMALQRGCPGPDGCTSVVGQVRCDDFVANEEEPTCDEGRLACKKDRSAVMWCHFGRWQVSEKCAKSAGCRGSTARVACE